MDIRQRVEEFIKNNANAERARILKDQIPTDYQIKGVDYKVLEKFAKGLAKEGADIQEMPLDYYEEILLAGMVVAYSDKSAKEKVVLLGKILPCLDNWAAGDFLVPRIKGLESQKEFFVNLLSSENPFEVRFAIVWFKKYELKKNVKDVVNILNDKVANTNIYVEMALAWTYLEAFLIDYDFMINFVEQIKRVSVRNRVLEKACDSTRLSIERRKEILELRSKLLKLNISIFRQSKEILNADK